MKILALETSLRQGSLAALAGNGNQANVIHQAILPGDQRTAQSLLPAIQELCTECGWQPAELELIAVTTGPGSFTGLRIGVTTAKSLAYATGAKLAGVHTLATLAASFPLKANRAWAVMDAQREELFVACFEQTAVSQLVHEPETRILSIASWLDELQAGDVVTGPPLERLADRLPEGVVLAERECWQPQATLVGQLGYAALQESLTINPMQLVPNYYRKSAAEEKAAR